MPWLQGIGPPVVAWIVSLPTELQATLARPDVWFAFAFAAVSLVAVTVVGGLVARVLGVLDDRDGSAGTFAISAGVGLVLVAVAFAAVRSAGRSAFTPIAIAFAITIVVAVRARRGRVVVAERRSPPRFPT